MERLACDFFLIRYVPDVVKGEFINIGVLLREAGGDGGRSASERRSAVQFTRDWGRVRCLDADADVSLLEGMEQEIAERFRLGVNAGRPKEIVEELEDTLSNSVQISERRATLAENMATAMEELMRWYVEPRKVSRARDKTARALLYGHLRTEFERAGVWGLMRKRISAAIYTQAGDPLKIDCGYRAQTQGVSSVARMFHAVSLEGDVEMAKGLAFSAPQMRDGVRRVEGAELELIAVVEPLGEETRDESDEAYERYRFGVETMERQQIRVVTVSHLAAAAETARRELGL